MKKYFFTLSIIAFTGIFIFNSCQKKISCTDCNENPPSEVDIYVAGSLDNHTDNTYIPTLWKNGVAQSLPADYNQVWAKSVYVAGSDVYVAGAGDKARLWKNGMAQTLTDASSAPAMSVFVSGTDVYVAGGNKVWKNGVAQNLTDGSFGGASAMSVFVSGTDVYVAGAVADGATYQIVDDDGTVYTYRKNVAKLWKNGQARALTDGTKEAVAWSVCASGSDVYVAGGEGGRARLWKNGVAQILDGFTDASSRHDAAQSVYVSGSDVYVAGSEGNIDISNAKLWKNGVAQNLTSGRNWDFATSVYVSRSDVYVVGSGINGVKLWKNGVVQNLTGISEAFSVFVVRK
jgi:hypothetical protein